MRFDNELYHHGIKGMKWGIRRTPEQLGYRKTSSKKKTSTKSEAQKKKEKAAKAAEDLQKKKAKYAKSPTSLYKHRNLYSKEEIESLIKKFETEKKLYELGKAERERGKEYADTAIGYVDNAIKAWNRFADVSNAVAEGQGKSERLPTLPERSGGGKKKK